MFENTLQSVHQQMTYIVNDWNTCHINSSVANHMSTILFGKLLGIYSLSGYEPAFELAQTFSKIKKGEKVHFVLAQ